MVKGMSLRNIMGIENVKVTSVGLSLIKKNDLNFYEVKGREDFEAKVKALKLSIKDKGLLQPILVMKNSNLDNGYQYEILSGHTRFQAVCELYEEGLLDDDTIDCKIIDEDMEQDKVVEYLFESNIQRTKNINQIQIEINHCDKQYEKDKELARQRGERIAQRDVYVAEKLGVSERTVRNYRKKIENINNQNSDSENGNSHVYTPRDVYKSIERISKSLKKNIELVNSLVIEESMKTILTNRLRRALAILNGDL